jgi:hydroxymethylglutaryl-CoA lyase
LGTVDSVTITDVTLREYGQNVPSSSLELFTPEIRIEIAKRLMRAGISSLEVFSCVLPKIAPAMNKRAIQRIAAALGQADQYKIITLVPNKAGYKNFLAWGLGPDRYNHTLGVFFSAVEAHNILNLGRPIEETIDEYRIIVKDAVARNIRVAGYVSAAFGFSRPGETKVIRPSPEELGNFLDFYFDLGVETVTLSDLQGVADERETLRVVEAILNKRKGKDLERLGYHPHHVSGEKALANSRAVYELGIRRFDGSLGGTGGCVTGAPGNQPTEGLVRLFESMGIRTGLNGEDISSLADFVRRELYSKISLLHHLPPP